MSKLSIFFIALFLTACDTKKDSDCELLIALSSDAEVYAVVNSTLRFLNDNPRYASKFGKKSGLVFVRDLNTNIGLDFEDYGIPNESLSFEIMGENIDYKNFKLEDVEAFKFGFGYRKHLAVIYSDSFRKEYESQFIESQFIYNNNDLIVTCR